MTNEIEKSEQPNPDDVLAAIQNFNDPAIITNMFRELGWSYSLEIRETVQMAKQNANLSIKFKAIKHLRELLREAAETSGYVANVSKTIKNPQGGQTTFSAKRIANVLNPTKQIESTEIKESQNDRPKTEPNRGCDRAKGETFSGIEPIKSQESSSGCESECVPKSHRNGESRISPEGADTLSQFPPERDTGRADSGGDVESGGIESPDGGETPRPVSGGGDDRNPDNNGKCENSGSSAGGDAPAGEGDNPCVKTRPPTGDRKLFPGISSADN